MAISVQPVDGLIHRLLQQNGKTPSISGSQDSSRPVLDHVSISAKGQENPRHLLPRPAQAHIRSRERRLWNHTCLTSIDRMINLEVDSEAIEVVAGRRR